MNAGTISEFLKAGADDAPALNAPGGTALSYRDLRALVADVAESLASQGIGPGDRVGIVLDNGPGDGSGVSCSLDQRPPRLRSTRRIAPTNSSSISPT